MVRDAERALGLPLRTGYHIITNASPFAKAALGKHKNVCLVAELRPLSTLELLKHPRTEKYLKKFEAPHILVFKNTPLIERWCEERGLPLLNPPAALAQRVEEKISQLEWLGPLASLLPPHQILLGKNLPIQSYPYIAQFNRSHTGHGTFLIDSSAAVMALASKFPERPVRVTRFIAGPVLTLNAAVWGTQTLVATPSYQITGQRPFTSNAFATIGNDWALPKKLLTAKQLLACKKIAAAVGERLAKSGWRGLFGIDVVAEETTGAIYLLEINARQAASASFESLLQAKTKHTAKQTTTFAAHLAAVLQLPYHSQQLIPVTSGAQLIARLPDEPLPDAKIQKLVMTRLKKLRCTAIAYTNSKPGEDYIRVQCRQPVMQDETHFTHLGDAIAHAFI